MMDDRTGMPRGDSIEDLLVEQMHADLARQRWWQTLWGRISIAAGTVTLASTSLAAVILLEPRPVTETGVVHCLEANSRDADGSLSGAAVSIATPNGVIPLDDAIAVCRQMWESGRFNSLDPRDPSPTPASVPEQFTVCVTPDGAAAVAPGRAECSALKLNPYAPDTPKPLPRSTDEQ